MSSKSKKSDSSLNPQDVWLAGLSALHQAQAQGQKAVQDLVAQGEALQSQAQHQWNEIAQRVGNPFAAAAPAVSRLEGIFEHRVAQALQAIGVPTSQEVKALQAEMAQLKAQIAALQAAPEGTPRTKSTKASAARSSQATSARSRPRSR